MKPANEKTPQKLARLKVLEVLGKRCLAGIDDDDTHIFLVIPYRGAWQLIRCDTKPEQMALRAFVPSEDGELVHALIESDAAATQKPQEAKEESQATLTRCLTVECEYCKDDPPPLCRFSQRVRVHLMPCGNC